MRFLLLIFATIVIGYSANAQEEDSDLFQMLQQVKDYVARGDQAMKLGWYSKAETQYYTAIQILIGDQGTMLWPVLDCSVEAVAGMVRARLASGDPIGASAICDGQYWGCRIYDLPTIARNAYKKLEDTEKLIECLELCVKSHRLAGLDYKIVRLEEEIKTLQEKLGK